MSPDAMCKRFYEATDELAAIRAQAAPLRAEYDARSQEIARLQLALAPLSARLKEIEAPAYELDMERGRISRALNGKIGPRPKG